MSLNLGHSLMSTVVGGGGSLKFEDSSKDAKRERLEGRGSRL